MQDLVPCVLVTFDKEQIVVWRGRNYSAETQCLSNELVSLDDTGNCDSERKTLSTNSPQNFDSDLSSFIEKTSTPLE